MWFTIPHVLLFNIVVNEGTASAVLPARPKYEGIANALITIGKSNGVRGLYQGVAPNMCGSGVAWGFYFMMWVLKYYYLKWRYVHKNNWIFYWESCFQYKFQHCNHAVIYFRYNKSKQRRLDRTNGAPLSMVQNLLSATEAGTYIMLNWTAPAKTSK